MFAILLPTFECNLSCSYCFESHPSGRWSLEQAELVLSRIVEACQRTGQRRLSLYWQGGEILLMGSDWLTAVLTHARDLAADAGISLEQSLQTNLIQYSEKIRDISFAFLGGQIGTSFEFSGMRHFKNDSGVLFADHWMKAHERALEDGLRVGVLSLLDQDALDVGPVVMLKKLNQEASIRHLRFTLPFRQKGERGGGYWLDPESAGRFLSGAWDIWKENGGDSWMTIEPFALLESHFTGDVSTGRANCMLHLNCAAFAMTVLPNGDLILCDNFAHNSEYTPWGNIFQSSSLENLWSLRHDDHSRLNNLITEQCISCRYLSICGGGCPARVRSDRPQLSQGFYYCRTNQLLFEHIESRTRCG